jgi:hypothetical protein
VAVEAARSEAQEVATEEASVVPIVATIPILSPSEEAAVVMAVRVADILARTHSTNDMIDRKTVKVEDTTIPTLRPARDQANSPPKVWILEPQGIGAAMTQTGAEFATTCFLQHTNDFVDEQGFSNGLLDFFLLLCAADSGQIMVKSFGGLEITDRRCHAPHTFSQVADMFVVAGWAKRLESLVKL